VNVIPNPRANNDLTELTDHIIEQGKALVRAIEALGTIDPSGPFERIIAGLLLAAYKQRLREPVGFCPAG